MPQWAAGLLGRAGERQGTGAKVGKVRPGACSFWSCRLRVVRVVRDGVKGGADYDYLLRSQEDARLRPDG